MKKTITIKIEYNKKEGRILVGKDNLILAKIYSTSDGLLINTIDEQNKKLNLFCKDEPTKTTKKG